MSNLFEQIHAALNSPNIYAEVLNTVTAAFIEHGSIEAHKDERSIVAFILAQLATQVKADHQVTENDIAVSHGVAQALFYLRDIKTLSHVEPDIPQSFRDRTWRTADLAQVGLENLLSQVSQEELNAWHDVR